MDASIQSDTCLILHGHEAVSVLIGETLTPLCLWCGAEMIGDICQTCFERETGHGGTE